MITKDYAILLDLDDTLVVEYESAQKSFSTTCEYASEFGIDPDFLFMEVQQKAREIWHRIPTYEYCLRIGISSWEGLWANFIGEHEKIKELHSLRKKYQTESWYQALVSSGVDNLSLAEELSQRFRAERRKRHILKDNALEILKLLSERYRLGLITNGTPDLQREKIEGAGIGSFFEHIIISGEVDIGKPDKEIFLLAATRFNLKVDKFIMVGDSIRTDINGARNAGIKSIWLNSQNKINNDNIDPTAIIHSLSQLPEEIERIIKSNTITL
jgi:putative hydrolase of the HAD superfamily